MLYKSLVVTDNMFYINKWFIGKQVADGQVFLRFHITVTKKSAETWIRIFLEFSYFSIDFTKGDWFDFVI